MKLNIRCLLVVVAFIVLIAPMASAKEVHKEFDWEDDGFDVNESPEGLYPPSQDWEGCYACHNSSIKTSAPLKICEDCHLKDKPGPHPGPAGPQNDYELRDDYNTYTPGVPMVYEHYTGADVHVGDQAEGFDNKDTRCFGFSSDTGKGTCHGVSNVHATDGYYAFKSEPTYKQCQPYLYTTDGTLPKTSDCAYCHTQSDTAIIEAWGGAGQVNSSHYEATTDSDCYRCHVEGGGKPANFHVAGLSPVDVSGGEETPPSPGGGPTAAPSVIKEGINTVTSDLMRSIIKELNLRYEKFYFVDEIPAIAATLLVTGEYPASKAMDIDVQRALSYKETITGDVYEISAERVSNKYTFANTIVIARGDLEVDSMAAVAYAKSTGIPILLTKPGELPGVTLDAVKKLKPKNIVIAGGPVAVSEEVAAELAKLATVEAVERKAGDNREETAVELAKGVENPDTIVITDSKNPSVEAVIISASYKAPLIYVGDTEIPEIVKAYLAEHKTAKLVLVGVSEGIADEIEDLMK